MCLNPYKKIEFHFTFYLKLPTKFYSKKQLKRYALASSQTVRVYHHNKFQNTYKHK